LPPGTRRQRGNDNRNIVFRDAWAIAPRPVFGLIDVAHLDVGTTAQFEAVLRDELPDEVVFHVPPNAFDDRNDGDEEHDANGDADQRKEALELLDADLREGKADGFEDRHAEMSGRGWTGDRAKSRARAQIGRRPSLRRLGLVRFSGVLAAER
jgi:hypothetical protein